MRTAGLLGSIELPATEISVSAARAYVRDLLIPCGCPRVDEVELLVTELVANSVSHSASGRREGGRIRVEVTATGDLTYVSVADEGSATPLPVVPSQVDPLAERGRGLWLVRELSSAWGWKDDAAGRTVWFAVTDG
ncbi:ATP-binding protein [Sphaerisporangium album]|uniref:ATP-binding protein n=1 Tax=Sphaerisporangium album TaxID=509200 RepID=UPI0015F0ADDF|nr:ATP-binding protein [Sphaerisporangium album]